MGISRNLTNMIVKVFVFLVLIYTYFFSRTKYEFSILILLASCLITFIFIFGSQYKIKIKKFEIAGLGFIFYVSILALIKFETNIFVSTGKIILVFILYYIIRIIKDRKIENNIINGLKVIGNVYVLLTAIELFSRPLYFLLVGKLMTVEAFSKQYSLDVYNNHIGGFAQINTINAFILGITTILNVITNRRGLSIIVNIIALLGIVFSGGKTAFFSFIITIVFYYLLMYYKGKKRVLVIVFCGIILFLGILLILNTGLFSNILEYQKFDRYFDRNIVSESFSSRENLYDIAISIFIENPLFGIGIGGFSYYSNANNVHNLFLQLISETGILGTMLFLFYWFGMFFSFIRVKEKNNIVTIAILVNIYFLLNSIFSNALFLPMMSCIFFIINSIAVNNYVNIKSKKIRGEKK